MMAGAVVPAPPPPEKVVREKLVFTSTFRFKYQLRPTDQADADLADAVGSANKGNASRAMSRRAYRATSCTAPQWPAEGSKGWAGTTPVWEASSPVRTQEPV